MLVVAVTGADGFVGRHLCEHLTRHGHEVIRLVRRHDGASESRRVVGDLESAENLPGALEGVDAIVHLAGRAHVLFETEDDPLSAFTRANVLATEKLAGAAVEAGVRRFVFLSSIGVNGSRTTEHAFSEEDSPSPSEPYAISKLEAEKMLRERYADRLEIVTVRPPLVYGPGAAGNFRRLIKLANSAMPLPLGSVRNRRNLIGVQNLCHFLQLCIERGAAAGELFLVAEPEARSTPELLRALACALNRPCRLMNIPVPVMRTAATLVGRRAEFDKLCGSLEMSSAKAARLLGWKPQTSFEEQLNAVAAAYREEC